MSSKYIMKLTILLLQLILLVLFFRIVTILKQYYLTQRVVVIVDLNSGKSLFQRLFTCSNGCLLYIVFYLNSLLLYSG